MTTLGAKYVLDDDDAAVEKPASIATFEVEQPRSAKASLAQQKKGKTFDVFVEQDKVLQRDCCLRPCTYHNTWLMPSVGSCHAWTVMSSHPNCGHMLKPVAGVARRTIHQNW